MNVIFFKTTIREFMKAILLIVTILTTSIAFAKSVNVKNRKTKEVIHITSEKSLCSENDVIVCDFALVTLTDGDMKKELIALSDKVSIYTVTDALSRAHCRGAYSCRFELPYAKTVNVVKEFKGAAVIQAPFYLVSDTIRLPYLVGKGIVHAIRNKMSKGRKIIKSLDPLKADKKRIRTVRFNDRNFGKIQNTLESIL
jgi:hypothetical protein